MGVIPRSLRFRIFQRDGFHCQYCGVRGTPDNPLEVDHIDPRAHGGKNAASNLITACFDCNRGKRDALLTRDQIAEFSGRPLPVVEPNVSPNRVTRRVIRRQAKPHVPRREKVSKPLPIPVSTRFVYVAPDVINPLYKCAICGFINELEGDRCSCHHVKERPDVFWCVECGEGEVGSNGDLCRDCEDRLFCRGCREPLEDPDENDYCPSCQSEHDETERMIDLGLIVRCGYCGFEQRTGNEACAVCGHLFSDPPRPLWEVYSR